MISSVTKTLAAGAALFGGLLAGVTLNRALVELPAWRRLSFLAWAEFTRAESSGFGGVFYPALGLAALLLIIGTAVAYYFDRDKRLGRSAPIYASVVVAIAWASVTRFVLVPKLFELKTATDNALELRQIFLSVELGSAINDILHVLTFMLGLWAVVALCSEATTTETK